ncbi:MAG TPA: helix-turn-helix domain-containing protein [Acidimicrobiales bacterium]|nr:helix-turn-helix domain-containing protein [Acidimicrobiales bacterium]
MPEVERILESLQATGMSGYEAKAYLALLGAGEPINGYEVAKRSGVPRSTVYESLAKLLLRGAAFEIRTENGSTLYVALPPQTLIQRLSRSFQSHLDHLNSVLPEVTEPVESHLVHNMDGRSAVLERAADLIYSAKKELYVSAWAEELDELRFPLEDAVRKRVDIVLLRFGDSSVDVGASYNHVFSSPEVVLDRVGCRLLVIAPDRESVLIGGAVGENMWGLFSDDPAVVLLAVEYVRHDISYQVLVEELGIDRVRKLTSTNPTLRRLETGRGAPGLERRGLEVGPTG